MKKVLTGIDIGSDLIKIVVTEVYENHFYTLAATNVHTSGVKKRVNHGFFGRHR